MLVSYIYPFTESFLDYPNADSLCMSIYFLGCDNGCEGCSNPELADKDSNIGRKDDVNTLINRINNMASRAKIKTLTFIGGDPLYKKNIDATRKLIFTLKDHYDICIYTGHDIKYVKENNIIGFTFIKVNKYMPDFSQESTKTDEYLQFASKNQQLYDYDFNLLSSTGRYYFK